MTTEMSTQTGPDPQEDQSFTTNPYAADFDKPNDQQKTYLVVLDPIQRKDHKD